MRVSVNWHLKMAVVAGRQHADLWSNPQPRGYHGFLSRNKILAPDVGAETIDPDRMR
jgi:hypothetical protein